MTEENYLTLLAKINFLPQDLQVKLLTEFLDLANRKIRLEFLINLFLLSRKTKDVKLAMNLVRNAKKLNDASEILKELENTSIPAIELAIKQFSN